MNLTYRQLAQLYGVSKNAIELWKSKGVNIQSAPDVVRHIRGNRSRPKAWKFLGEPPPERDSPKYRGECEE